MNNQTITSELSSDFDSDLEFTIVNYPVVSSARENELLLSNLFETSDYDAMKQRFIELLQDLTSLSECLPLIAASNPQSFCEKQIYITFMHRFAETLRIITTLKHALLKLKKLQEETEE